MKAAVMLEPIERVPVSEAVFRRLRDRIMRGELATGASLPAERDLSEQAGVNRNAVREAIKRLQQAGLVAVRQGGRSVVLDFRTEGGLDLLSDLLMDDRGRLQPAVARSIFALRASLAPSVAAAAARRGGPSTAAALDTVVDDMAAIDRVEDRQALALEFWRHCVEASGNIAFRLAFNSMQKTYHKVWPMLTQALAAEFRDLENLRALAAAVRRGDGEAAADCARRHVAIGSAAIDLLLPESAG